MILLFETQFDRIRDEFGGLIRQIAPLRLGNGHLSVIAFGNLLSFHQDQPFLSN